MRKKNVIATSTLFLAANRVFAQQWVLDEMYDEQRATRSEEPSFGYIVLGLIILAAVILVIGIIINLVRNHKESIKEVAEEHAGCLILIGIFIFLCLIGVINNN